MSTSPAVTQEAKSIPIGPGDFVWYELVTPDLDAAEKFYKNVIGWTTCDSGMSGMRYTLVSAGETQIAGMMSMPGAPPGWLGYIAVPDVDTFADRVQKAGGKIYRAPQDIPNIGRFSVVADPQGAVFVLFKGTPIGEGPKHPSPGALGFVGWNELYTAELESAFAFYHDIFAWQKTEAFQMGPMGLYQTFATNPAIHMAGGMMNLHKDAPGSGVPGLEGPHWMFYFTVDDIRAAIERVKAGGGKITHGPVPVPGGSFIAHAQDPQGAFFGMSSAKG